MAQATKTPEFFHNNYGFLLTFTIGDVSTSTNFRVSFVKPAVAGVRAVVEHDLDQTAILDAVKGIVGYVVAEGDLDLTGSYLVQLTDTTPGRFLSTKEQRFTVKPTIDRFKPAD